MTRRILNEWPIAVNLPGEQRNFIGLLARTGARMVEGARKGELYGAQWQPVDPEDWNTVG
jgi:hypothetical protein